MMTQLGVGSDTGDGLVDERGDDDGICLGARYNQIVFYGISCFAWGPNNARKVLQHWMNHRLNTVLQERINRYDSTKGERVVRRKSNTSSTSTMFGED